MLDFLKKLMSPNNGLGRTFRGLLQAAVGITAWLYGFLSIPGVQDYLTRNNLVAIGTLLGFITAVTAIHNAAGKILEWLKGL